jgi:K+-sensing histidine kinase KdpD
LAYACREVFIFFIMELRKAEISNPVQVLVVDDEDLSIKIISRQLEYHHFAVSSARNGSDAMEFLEKNPDTDIVLLDINLGFDFSGIELIPIIIEKNKYVQIIMLTSENTLETAVECMRRGASDYLTKPFDEKTFLEKVPGALERKKCAQLNDLYLGIIVHDMNNPLQVFMSSIELLRLSVSDGLADRQKQLFHRADLSTHQMHLMVNNILSVSRFENGSYTVRNEPFTLHKEVKQALSLFTSETGRPPGSPRLRISYGPDENLVVAADKELFRLVLANIVNLALRFSEEDSPVEVAFVGEENGILHVKTICAGLFIEEEARETILNKFSSVQIKPGQSGFKNYGLGLTFSKLAVKTMTGRLWITCDARKTATTFHFTVPTGNKKTPASD